jgi:hypothetical protein
MQLIYKIILSILILLNLNGYALSRVSTLWEDSGSFSGGFLANFLALLIIMIPAAIIYLWEEHKINRAKRRPDLYNTEGERVYRKNKKSKNFSDKFIKTFKIQTLDANKIQKRKRKRKK